MLASAQCSLEGSSLGARVRAGRLRVWGARVVMHTYTHQPEQASLIFYLFYLLAFEHKVRASCHT